MLLQVLKCIRIFHHLLKNLDRTITFNSVTQKYTTELQKYISFVEKKLYLESADKI